MVTHEVSVKPRRRAASRAGEHKGRPGEIARDLLQSLVLLLLLAAVLAVRIYVTAPG